MLGLLLIYYIGNKFYQLAFEYEKSGWGYAIIGVITYYGITFLSGFVFAYVYLEFIDSSMDSGTEFGLTVLSIPIGLLGAFLLYKSLERNWKKTKESGLNNDILDQGLL